MMAMVDQELVVQKFTREGTGVTQMFCDDELASLLDGRCVRQINHSRTEAVGAIRGLHYQRAPAAEMKLVRCMAGRVWDVAVDLRRGVRRRPQPGGSRRHRAAVDGGARR